MSVYRPLVIKDGVIQQLQDADTLNAKVPNAATIGFSNTSGVTIPYTAAVCINSSGSVQLGNASALATSRVIGFCSDPSGIPNNTSGTIKADGIQEGFTGLSAGKQYFLSETLSGVITDTPPTTNGKYVVAVGVAISDTEIYIEIAQPIGL